jgi:D-alanyl-D-alanine dipeptidase
MKINLSLCLIAGCATQATDRLVDIKAFDPRILVEVPYATDYNFMKKPVYDFGGHQPTIFVHQRVADYLKHIQTSLKPFQLLLKIYDGYRPLSVQQQMWDMIQDDRYVSNPAVTKGRHTRGTAVDCTLCYENGEELIMPTPFDDFSSLAAAEAIDDILPEALFNRKLLVQSMEKHNFKVLPTEWWHFDFNGWESDETYPPLDISFAELLAQSK